MVAQTVIIDADSVDYLIEDAHNYPVPPCITKNPVTGYIHVLYVRYYLTTFRHRLVDARSQDGKTWEINEIYETSASSVSFQGISLCASPNGQLSAIFSQWINNYDSRICRLTSDDDGNTWSALDVIHYESSPGVGWVQTIAFPFSEYDGNGVFHLAYLLIQHTATPPTTTQSICHHLYDSGWSLQNIIYTRSDAYGSARDLTLVGLRIDASASCYIVFSDEANIKTYYAKYTGVWLIGGTFDEFSARWPTYTHMAVSSAGILYFSYRDWSGVFQFRTYTTAWSDATPIPNATDGSFFLYLTNNNLPAFVECSGISYSLIRLLKEDFAAVSGWFSGTPSAQYDYEWDGRQPLFHVNPSQLLPASGHLSQIGMWYDNITDTYALGFTSYPAGRARFGNILIDQLIYQHCERMVR